MDSDAANNDKKITWTRQTGNSAGSATSTPAANQAPTDLPIDPVDLSTRFADKTSVAKGTPTSSNDIDALKGEIEAALSRQNVPADDPNQTVVRPRSDRAIDLDAPDSLVDRGTQDSYTPSEAPAPVEVSPSPLEKNQLADNVKQDEAALVASLKGDIQREVSAGREDALNQEATPASIPETSQDDPARGVGQTYYSDLSRAMSSNEPATMSELIRKARFEEKESKILSPKSKKNIAFIAGAVILLVASIAVLGSVFRGEPKVEFITEERVSSLVRSNLDTGINTTGLESARIKGAIRDVIEMKIPEDAVNQIYYVEEDGLGNLRRLGLKNIFEKTDSQVPTLLYDNVENTFTHGVFKTDKNYPFIVMKALSYDRALQGMLEWEPTMIDDLAPYLDLPPEATDRSLLKDGFEDDLIRNKTVRVARFLPREVDRRGILDFLNGGGDDTDTGGEGENLGLIHRIQVALGIAEPAYAQDLNWDFGGGNGGDNTQRVCYNDAFPGQTFGPEFEEQAGYYCVNVISGGDTIGQISSVDPVCFDPVTGDRIDLNGTMNPAWFCFESYQCYRYSCFQGGVDIGPGNEGVPGATCREVTEEGPKFYETGPRYNPAVDAGQKICRQFTGLLSLQNINSALLCFDESGRYLPNYTSPDAEGGITCITPMSRQETICVSRAGDLVPPTFPGEKLCFEPLANASTSIDVNNQCADLTLIEIQQRLMSAAFELRFIAEIGSLFGLSDTDVNNLYQAAATLEDLAYTNVLQIDVVRETAFILQQIEVILDTIDPNQELPIIGQNGGLNLYGHLRLIIDTVKCALGIGNTLQWSTLGQIPQGITIYAGQILPEVEPIQQFLVLVGLMDPVSVTGALDLVTQDAISQLQLANALEVTGIIDPDTLLLIQGIVEGQGSIYGDEAIINDYFVTTGGILDIDGQILTLGAYNDTVEALQVLLYAEGYDILTINGLFDGSTCRAVQAFQADQGLEVSDDFPCTVGDETLEALNQIIRDGGYLGSGFVLNPQGYLEGTGTLEGTYGPGIVDFTLNPADADSLNEGDVVLLYTFLDEETILIARDQVVIDEIIRRRALDDIFE